MRQWKLTFDFRGLFCQTFCPEQQLVGSMFSAPVFEDMLKTRQRLKDWALTYAGILFKVAHLLKQTWLRHVPQQLMFPDSAIVCSETVYMRLSSDLPEELWSAVSAQRRQLDFHASQIAVLRVYFWTETCDVTDDTDEEKEADASGREVMIGEVHAYERMD